MTLNIVSSFNGVSDPDAAAYIEAVEAADGELLEFAVGKAINDFVLGCKADGIWSSIKASCILAGARTLSGALVPLAGTAPTNFNFVSGDYNRKTGLVGDGSTKYLNSNRNNNADPQNSKHVAVYVTTAPSAVASSVFPCYIGAGLNADGATNFGVNLFSGLFYTRHHDSGTGARAGGSSTGAIGLNRSDPASYVIYSQSSFATISRASQIPFNGNLNIFQDNTPGASQASNARIAFYSIGESLNLAFLDARVTDLITAFGAAIP